MIWIVKYVIILFKTLDNGTDFTNWANYIFVAGSHTLTIMDK